MHPFKPKAAGPHLTAHASPWSTRKAAEAVGFKALWASEMVHDPFVPLAAVASATHRIELGTATFLQLYHRLLACHAVAIELVRCHRVKRIHDRWIGAYAAQAVGLLDRMKTDLENDVKGKQKRKSKVY